MIGAITICVVLVSAYWEVVQISYLLEALPRYVVA